MEKKHLYNSKIGKIKWFIKRFGIKEIYRKPLRRIFAPLIIKLIPKRQFLFEGEKYNLFYHQYNITWANERCVEIPVIKDIVSSSREDVLEIGNVLSHYFHTDWDIVDKFEKGKNIINKDILEFKPTKKYGLIVSISTFEHIGYDDNTLTDSKGKILECFNNIKRNCMKKDGLIIITTPVGYNPDMDNIIFSNKLKFNKSCFLKRNHSGWIQVNKKEASKIKYGKPFPYANCVFIGFYKK